MKRPFAVCFMAAALVLAAAYVAEGCRRKGPTEAPQQRPEPQDAQAELPMVTITVGQTPLQVEVADEAEERRMGYMFRDPPGERGMLFVWPDEGYRTFLMENTPFDIDLAYIAEDGTIFQIERMKAYRLIEVDSLRPAKFVLEVAAGWFAEHGVARGTVVKVPPEVQAEE